MNQYIVESLIRVACFFQDQYWTSSSFLQLKYQETFTASEVPRCLKHSAAYFGYIYTFTGSAPRPYKTPSNSPLILPIKFSRCCFSSLRSEKLVTCLFHRLEWHSLCFTPDFVSCKVYQAVGLNLLQYTIFSNTKKREETSINSCEIEIFCWGNIFPKEFWFSGT
jgi:hypothetical protein